MEGMIPVDTINAILEEIAQHAADIGDRALDTTWRQRTRLALAVGRAAAILELAKLGLQKIEG